MVLYRCYHYCYLGVIMWTSYKDVKICVYAICADEPESFIDRWLDSMKGADYICVLVTKRANDNYFYLQEKQKLDEFKDKLIVDETGISPWRFDVARNESLKLVPKDSDALICTDIDEVMIDDFWDDYRRCVFEHPDFSTIYYKYSWSVNADGSPGWSFWYDKTHHLDGYRWQYPVHETLTCDIPNKYSGKYYLDKDKIYLWHYPDNTKSRSSYLGLLKLRVEENPNDDLSAFYLAREYTFVNDWKNAALTAFNSYITILKTQSYYKNQLAATGCILGKSLHQLGLFDEAEYFYRSIINKVPTYRETYIRLAQLLAYQPKPQEVYSVILQMYNNSIVENDWRQPPFVYRDWKINQIIADAKCWEGKYDEAFSHMQKALDDIKTQKDFEDALRENLLADKNFIEQTISKISEKQQ